MKKHLNILLLLAVALLGLSSCEDDKDPVLQKPTTFVLNTPATAALYYTLTPDGTIGFTFSQPDYGNPIVANYYVQVSLTEDFANFEELEDAYTKCVIDVPDQDIAAAICKLRGITKESEYTDEPARAVYFRIRSVANPKDENSVILSNVVKLDQVKGYYYLPLPGVIYLVGAPSGWVEPSAGNADKYEGWTLSEDENAIGSLVYSGTFDIAAGQAQFRFYTKLSGWDEGDSYGSQTDDNPVDITWDAATGWNGSLVKGKGSFNIPDWAGGKIHMVVDMSGNTYSVAFTPAE